MTSDTSWGKDTVSLGPADSAAREAQDVDSRVAPELAKVAAAGDASWGTETVVLGHDRAGRANGSANSGRREPPGSRAVVATVAGVVIAVLAIGVTSLIGAGGGRWAQPAAPALIRSAPDRQTAEPKTRIHEERRRRAERKAKAAQIARERRLRERRHRQRKAARARLRVPSEPAPVSAQAPEVQPEYVPEYAPQAASEPAPAPEAAPPPAPSPTPPGVEFGM